VRKCRIDLAPNAPWECPADCPGYAKRLADVGWDYGSLGNPIADPTDDVTTGTTDDAAQILDQAEDVVNAIGPDLLAEFQALDKASTKKKRWKRKKK
jgi:hypothetical protein